MKKLGIAIGVFVGIGFIAPKFIGNFVETKYQETIDKLAKHPSFTITERQFSRGWFSGVSIVKITPKGHLSEFENFKFTVKEDIRFGPFILDDSGFSFNLATSSSRFSFDQNTVPEEFVNALNTKLSLTSKVTYGMNYVTNIDLKEINQEQDGNSLKVGEMHAQFKLSDDKYITGTLDWQGLELNGPKAIVSISGAKIEMDQELISGDLYAANAIMTGGGVLKIPGLVVKSPTKVELFSLTDVEISGRSKALDDLLEMTINYGAKAIDTKNQNIKNANLNIILKNINADILTELNTVLTQMPTNTTQQEAAINMQKVIKVANKFLVYNPEIEMSDFSLETAQGLIQSDMLLVVDHSLYDPAKPMSFITALKVNAKANGPEAFFETLGLKPVLDMYIEQGFIIRDNNNLRFTAQFEKGQLTVNNKALPF